jgi:hypothetical protein
VEVVVPIALAKLAQGQLADGRHVSGLAKDQTKANDTTAVAAACEYVVIFHATTATSLCRVS